VATIIDWQADASSHAIAIEVVGSIPSRPGAQGALLRWQDGTLTTLALEGDPLPGGRTYGFPTNIGIDGAGGVLAAFSDGIYRFDTGGVQRLVGLADAPAGHSWYTVALARANEAGDILFDANETVAGSVGVHTLQIRSAAGVITEVLRAGAHTV